MHNFFLSNDKFAMKEANSLIYDNYKSIYI